MKMVGCVGNAPTLVRKDIRFTGGSRSLRGYQPGNWLGDVDSHHDVEAYETSLVLNLPPVNE
jgi:hypothetical protein